MREILFRGKRNGYADQRGSDWLEGSLFVGDNGECEICYGTPRVRITYSVIPKTVGRFTGLFDKNGKKIFEGDIVTIPNSKRQGLPATVEYFPQGAIFQIRRVGYSAITLWDANESVEVIGNVHDNPELLKGD